MYFLDFFRKRIYMYNDNSVCTIAYVCFLDIAILFQDYLVSWTDVSESFAIVISNSLFLELMNTAGVSLKEIRFHEPFFPPLAGFLWRFFSLGVQVLLIEAQPPVYLHFSFPFLSACILALSLPCSPNPSFVPTSPFSCDVPLHPALVFIHTNLRCPQSCIGLRIFWPLRLRTPPPADDIIKA